MNILSIILAVMAEFAGFLLVTDRPFIGLALVMAGTAWLVRLCTNKE